MKVAAQGLEQDAAAPATVSAAANELKRQYDSGQAAIPCFTLVCTSFTLQMRVTLHNATRAGKRKFDGQVEGKRIKKEAN